MHVIVIWLGIHSDCRWLCWMCGACKTPIHALMLRTKRVFTYTHIRELAQTLPGGQNNTESRARSRVPARFAAAIAAVLWCECQQISEGFNIYAQRTIALLFCMERSDEDGDATLADAWIIPMVSFKFVCVSVDVCLVQFISRIICKYLLFLCGTFHTINLFISRYKTRRTKTHKKQLTMVKHTDLHDNTTQS